MIRDRLYELKGPFDPTDVADNLEIGIEIDEEQHELYRVLNKFTSIRSQIHLITENIESMKRLINEQKFHYKDKSIKERMEALISDSLKKSQEVHKTIKVFQEELLQPTKSRTIFRIKNMQLALIKNEYLNAYREHSTFVEHYEEKLKKILKREAQIMSRNISVEETEELLLANRDGTPSLFTQNILAETQKAQNDLREIMQRHNLLINLEQTLEEVRDMFIQINLHVMEQGSMIQVIEYEVERAQTNVEKGEEELDKARELQIKALKKKTYILIILLIIFGVFILLMIIF